MQLRQLKRLLKRNLFNQITEIIIYLQLFAEQETTVFPMSELKIILKRNIWKRKILILDQICIMEFILYV